MIAFSVVIELARTSNSKGQAMRSSIPKDLIAKMQQCHIDTEQEQNVFQNSDCCTNDNSSGDMGNFVLSKKQNQTFIDLQMLHSSIVQQSYIFLMVL